MRVFELIGPIMFGPSSSHTAGACRLSRAMWEILGEPISSAHLELHGSFRVKEGGAVNKALVAGLLGFDTDDDRINRSHELMAESGIDFTYENVNIEGAHNNTVRYTVKGGGFTLKATGASVGGGMIEITEINGDKVSVTGDYNTLLIFCQNPEDTAPAALEIAGPDGTAEQAGGLALIKSAGPITEDAVRLALALPGVSHASRHLRFD